MSEAETQLSDRELDALVAERLMGWRDVTINRNDGNWITIYGCKPAWMSFPSFWQLQGAISKGRGGEEKRHIPDYSTDTACAFQVVEKMRERGFGVTLTTKHNFWRVEIYPEPDNGYDGLNVEDDSLAKAICLAALESVRVSDDDN